MQNMPSKKSSKQINKEKGKEEMSKERTWKLNDGRLDQ